MEKIYSKPTEQINDDGDIDPLTSIPSLEIADRDYVDTLSVKEIIRKSREHFQPSPESIKQLEEASIFLPDKIDILLASTGDKPSALIFLNSEEWEPGEDNKDISTEADKELRVLAESLGLHICSRDVDMIDSYGGQKIRFYMVSRSIDTLAALATIEDEEIDLDLGARKNQLRGELLGYPETATDAFIDGTGISYKEAEIHDLEIIAFGGFAYSPNNTHLEMQTALAWASEVKKTSPTLYGQLLSRCADELNNEGYPFHQPS
jgi:hypothetical protein